MWMCQLCLNYWVIKVISKWILEKILYFNIVLFKKSYNLSINSTNTFLYLLDLDCYSKITFRFLLNSNTKSSETAGLTWNNLWPLLLFNQNLSYKVHICKSTEVINKNIHKYIDNLLHFFLIISMKLGSLKNLVSAWLLYKLPRNETVERVKI